jgi:hypothetical protein
MTDNLFGDVAQVGIHLPWIIAMNSGDEVRTFAEIGLILLAPFNPFVVLVTGLHLAPRQLPVALGIPDTVWHRLRIGHSA